MKQFTDQLNRSIEFHFPPKRIVSLVPSQSELLVDLGMEEELVGITRFCIHPKHIFESKTKVGGTKNYNLDKIRALKPDLIIANKEENDKESLELLAEEFPVWISDIYNLEDNNAMILEVGKLCNKEEKAEEIVNAINKNFAALKKTELKQRVIYLIWQKPFMSINKNTFINEMLDRAGFENVFKDKDSRYPEVSLEEMQTKEPDFIFLSSEPYPFEDKHIPFFSEKFSKSKVQIVDGEMFSWYGSRIMKAATYLENLTKIELSK